MSPFSKKKLCGDPTQLTYVVAYEEAKRTLWGCNPRHKPIARKHGALAIACQHTTQPTRTQTHGASKQRPIGHEGRVEVLINGSKGTPRKLGGCIEDLCFRLGSLVTTRVSTRDKRKARPQRPSRPNTNRCPPSRGKLASGVY